MSFPAEKEYMITENMGLVKKEAGIMAGKFKSAVVGIDDLMQFGFIGMMKAAEKYDPSIGEFSTYATHYIRSYMKRGKQRDDDAVGAGINLVMLSQLIKARGHEDENPEELLETKAYKGKKYTVSMIEQAQQRAKLEMHSLDKKMQTSRMGVSGEVDFYNVVFDREAEDVCEGIIVEDFLSKLKPLYQEIMTESMKDRPLADIGRDMGKDRRTVHGMRVKIQRKWDRYERGLEKV